MTIAQQARGLSSLQKTTDRSRTTGAGLERGQEPTKNESELSNELEQTRAKLADRDRALIHANQWIEYLAERGAELEQQVAREASAPQILRDQVEALATQSSAADKRIAELERELNSACEEHSLRENENRSLLTSVNSIVNENWRLFRRLTESEAAAVEANEKRRTETSNLNTRFESMSSRAVAAEKLLAEVRHAAEKLLAEVREILPGRTNEKRTSERKVVDGAVARNAFDKRLEQLQNSLLIKLPTEMIVQLDPEATLVKDREKTKELAFKLQCERAVVEGAREEVRTNCTELHCE